jgi:hypothetical protein
MKVDVIEIFFSHAAPPPPSTVKEHLQKWLDHNPNATIEHVALAPVSEGTYGTTTCFYVTIFYRD